MATKSIDWNDGSGDKIYLTYPSASGDQTVQVTSDANRGAARATTVYFSTGEIYRQLIVEQEAALVPITDTLAVNPSGYIPRDEGSAYYGLSNAENAYNDENNTTYAMIRLTRGSASAVTSLAFTFNTSSIPAGATINSVECKAKIHISNAANVAVRQVQMFSGTTAMGSSVNATTTTRVVTFSGTDWTREQISDARIRFYAERGTSNLNSDYYFRFFGATLTINYTYMGVQQTANIQTNLSDV